MDVGSASLANRLVGNSKFDPVLEFTLKGPVLELVGQGHIAITGGHFEAILDQSPMPRNRAIEIYGNHTLSIGSVRSGCRGYFAVGGQWQIKPWLGSCSTAPQNAAQLTPESVIQKGSAITVRVNARNIPEVDMPDEPSHTDTIRILAGPEYHRIDTDCVKELLSKRFTISNHSNRMGYRLESVLSNYRQPLEIISSGVVPGTIQLTDSGQLIVLMADAQTTGGYPRIANVVRADLNLLGQMKPGDDFRFKLVSFNEAYKELTGNIT
jgi:antagonist of KipI